MSEVTIEKITYEELKHLVIQALRVGSGAYEFKNLCGTVARLAITMKFANDPNPPGHQTISYNLKTADENKVREVVWDFIIQRVVTIGDFHNHLWPWFSLTDYGKKAVQSQVPIPNDPTGYLGRLHAAIPELDEVIETYLLESIKTYNINQLLSSTITLGCASERCLLLLIDQYSESFKLASSAATFAKKVQGKFIKTQFEEFDKSFKQIQGGLPYDIRENYANSLSGIFQMIRYNRNSAGHPTGVQVDKETLFANLQVFIPYCSYVYKLIKYLVENKHD